MNSVELVKNICIEREIPISKLERDCGFSNGYIGKLKRGVFPADKLQQIAYYLDLPYDYLLTGGVSFMGQEPQYYSDEQYKLAQEFFESRDGRALFHMWKGMEPKKFHAHVENMKNLYKLEHPEEFE